MKVAFAENNVLGSSGLQETKGFQMRASAHAFKILSSGLYSDKVRAVLREIGCNAADAHVAAGCPERPFRVKLPNTLDDQFYVQDWGPGLAHDEVMSLYTTYFASTKQGSNDFTGAFGLGSKSPFSYTDSFSVVSAHGGRKRTYSLYIGNEGFPQVSLMSEEDADADWATGIRVGFAVKQQHFTEFQDKSQHVYQWFRTPPEMRGCPPVKPVQYRSDHDDFRVARDQGDAMLLMGNVAYPLDLDECGVEDPHHGQAAAKKIVNYAARVRGLVLPLPIGSVQVAASREALQYDPHSIKVIQERLDLAMRRLGQDMVRALEAAASGGWKELCGCADLLEGSMPGAIKYDFASFAEALGLEADLAVRLSPFVTKTDVPIPKLAGTDTACRMVKVKDYGKGRGRPTAYWISQGSAQTGIQAKLAIRPDTVIAQGVCAYGLPRAKKAVAEGKYGQILVFGRSDKARPTKQQAWAEAHSVAASLGGVDVIDLESLEAPPVKTSTKRRRSKGWKPELPVGQAFPYLGLAEEKDKDDLGNLPSQYFMCKVRRSRWGNVSEHARVYKASADLDKQYEWSYWVEVWDDYDTLQSAVALPASPESCAILKPMEVKSIKLLDLGWSNAWDAIHKYLERPELVKALRKRIKKRVLVAPKTRDEISGTYDWAGGLAWALGDGLLSGDVQRKLKEAGLLLILQQMVKARDSKQEEVIPPEVVSYQSLVANFKIENKLAQDVRDAVSVEDMNGAFCKRFPRTHLVSFGELAKSQKDLNSGILFVLDREV